MHNHCLFTKPPFVLTKKYVLLFLSIIILLEDMFVIALNVKVSCSVEPSLCHSYYPGSYQ